jgi:hypothetical protein
MESRFFLQGIAPDIARLAQSCAARFLHTLMQFILVLIKSIAAKDLPPRNRSWGRFDAMPEDDCIG